MFEQRFDSTPLPMLLILHEQRRIVAPEVGGSRPPSCTKDMPAKSLVMKRGALVAPFSCRGHVATGFPRFQPFPLRRGSSARHGTRHGSGESMSLSRRGGGSLGCSD